jgi:hypothetical protein
MENNMHGILVVTTTAVILLLDGYIDKSRAEPTNRTNATAVERAQSWPPSNVVPLNPRNRTTDQVTEVGAALWPAGTVGCTNGTTSITFHNGVVKFHGPFSKAFRDFTGTGTIDFNTVPGKFFVTMGEETCRVRITIEAVRDN